MDIARKVFDSLKEAVSINEIEILLKNSCFDKCRFDEEKYPRFDFEISAKEISELINSGLIKVETNKEGKRKISFMMIPHETLLAKLFYAVLWKQGDLQKIRHIIEGILSSEEAEKEDALVFYQFGKYLAAKESEPIIDQHVLRAFLFYKTGDQKEEKITQALISEYKSWITTGLKVEIRNEPDYKYRVDKIMFTLGKYLKSKSK